MLEHTNIPGSRNPKRYLDVLDILVAGIHVLTDVLPAHFQARVMLARSRSIAWSRPASLRKSPSRPASAAVTTSR